MYDSIQRAPNPYEKGTRYYDMYEANPYAPNKRTRQWTIWDSLANGLGFRSGYDIYTDEANQAMYEEDARIAKVYGEDQYNDPQQQAARVKAAGENPDLVGTGSANQAATAQMPQSAPDLTGPDPMEKVGALFNGISQAITIASGMTMDIAKTIGLFADNEGKAMANATGMKNMAMDFLLENIGDDMPHTGENGADMNMTDLYTSLFGNGEDDQGIIEGWGNRMHLNSRQKHQLREHAMGMFDSDKKFMYERWNNNMKARKDYGTTAGSKWTPKNDDFKDIIQCMAPLNEAMDKFIEESAWANAEDAENKREFNEAYDANQAARTENAANKREEQQAQLDENMKKAFSKVMNNLTKKAEDGNWFAFALTLILPMIYDHFMNGSVNVARNKQGSMQVQSMTF